MEKAWKLSMDDAGNPIHNEDLPSGKLLGLIEDRYRVFHVTDSVQQRNGRCMLGSQQSDGAQIERLLNVGQARSEFVQSCGEKLSALTLQVRVRILCHQQKQQLWISRRCHAVYSFQVFELGAMGACLSVIALARAEWTQAGQKDSEHQQRTRQIDSGSHKIGFLS